MDNLDKDYDYLLSMKIWSLTAEHIELLKKKLAEKKEELDNVSSRTPRDMWEEDLDYFMELWDVFEKDLNDFENNVGKVGKKKIKMPTLHANARAKAKQRALQRAKDRENGKEEMSVDESSEESVAVVIKDPPRSRAKTLGAKSQPATVGPKSQPAKSNTTHTKVTLKKKDEIQNKKGTRTLHDYFSMETSNSGSGSPKKKGPSKNTELSKSQKPPAKRTKSAKKKSSSSESKTLPSEVTTQNKTEKTDQTERSDSSVYDSRDGSDSEDNAESDSISVTEEESDIVKVPAKKPTTRNTAKPPLKNYKS